MQIYDISISDLKPYENNPRNNDAAVQAVAESIKQFGFKIPIVVDKNNIIVAGHTRYKAAKFLGMESVPVIRAVDLTDEQIKAFRLADNKTAELSQWDFDKLQKELESISVNMELFGFDFGDEMPDDAELDAVDIEPTNPISIKITFNKKADMQKIENDLRAYIDGIDGASVVVHGGMTGDDE